MKRIEYAKRAPFGAVDLPGGPRSIVVARGESVDVDDERAEALQKALKDGSLPGLTKDHFSIKSITAAKMAEEKGIEADAGAVELATAQGIDLKEVTGTGKDGKITKADVERAVADRG
jgi:pyruvate/2-oxoglutarate dehydrogenase complex dihydrolipoamide acyltransferase (E2) component